jgi:hypothetical protein
MLFCFIVALTLAVLYCSWRWHRWTIAIKEYGPLLPTEKWLSWPKATALVRKDQSALLPPALNAKIELPSNLDPQIAAHDSHLLQWPLPTEVRTAGLGAALDGAIVGMTAAEAFSHIDADFLHAIQFSTAEHLSSLPSIDSYVEAHFFDAPTGSAEGWLHRLEGYVGEQKAAIALEKAGHIVHFAPTANQQAWDLVVDGQPWQVKEGIELGGVKDALAHHAHIPIATGTDLAGQLKDPMVHGLHALDHDAIAATTKESLGGVKDGFHPGLKVPIVTIALSSWREYKLLRDDKTTFERALKSVAIDTVGVGAGMAVGAKVGAVAGSWGGPVGAGIGALIGGVAGAIFGRMGSHAYRFKDFNRAYEAYQAGHKDAEMAIYRTIDDSRSRVQQLGEEFQRRYLVARSDIETFVLVELEKIQSLYDVELDDFASRFPEYLRNLTAQLTSEENMVLSANGQPRWWGFLFPGAVELQRSLIRSWFSRARKRVLQEEQAYLSSQQDRQSLLARIKHFLTEYQFELVSLQQHLGSLKKRSQEMQDDGNRLRAVAVEKAISVRGSLILEFSEFVVRITDDMDRLITSWTASLKHSREWLRREARPLGVEIPN